MKKRKISILGLALVALLLFITGCSPNSAGNSSTGFEESTTVEGESLSASGTILLKVNPEIAIEYDHEGLVTRVVGENEDGEKIVNTYNDYIGKDSGLVLEELIALMHEAGYLVEEVEGEARRIVLELESGSALPEDDFLEVLSTNIQKAVSNLNTEADVVSEEEPVQNKGEETSEPEVNVEETAAEKPAEPVAEQTKAQEPTQTETKQAEYIGMDRAKAIALQHAGKEAAQVQWDDLEFEVDDGVPHYEVEFDVGTNEYDYEIHAETGRILEFEHELKGDQNRQQTNEQVPAEKQPTATKEVSREEAIQMALNHAGLSHADVVFDDVELEYEDGRKEWEIEFDHGEWEYEYEIDASNGEIIDFEKELDD